MIDHACRVPEINRVGRHHPPRANAARPLPRVPRTRHGPNNEPRRLHPVWSLARAPGARLSEEKWAAFARTGKYVCQGTTATVCNAPSAASSPERCGDRIDNDCNGVTDEDDASDATTWYQDCDGDGYSALTDDLISTRTGVRTTCIKPAAQDGCGWTSARPRAPRVGVPPVNWDCDDASTYYHPGADFNLPPPGNTRVDLNCDNVNEKQNAVGEPALGGSGFDSFPRCATSATCAQCGTNPDGGRVINAQWTANGQPTDTQPPCSVSATSLYPYRTNSGLGVCDEVSWPQPWALGAVQKCR